MKLSNLVRDIRLTALTAVNTVASSVAERAGHAVATATPVVDGPVKRLEEAYRRELDDHGNILLLKMTIQDRYGFKTMPEIGVTLGVSMLPLEFTLEVAGKKLWGEKTFPELKKAMVEMALTEDEAKAATYYAAFTRR